MTYHVHRLQNATTRTIWKTIQRHSTHNKPIPSREGQFDFGHKCKALRNALFPPVNTAPWIPLPPDLLTHMRDMCHHTRPVTTHETHLAIAHLKYSTSVGPDDISYTTLRHFNKEPHSSSPTSLQLASPGVSTPQNGRRPTAWSSPSPARNSTYYPNRTGQSHFYHASANC